ncbi:MAG TPA: hypothetical protein VFO34_03910 [Candidatus Acidoferrales bacterium]|nr:hypothetical protein [Candidatus Acidoferrales bacterium]
MTLPIQISQAELREISELERELPLKKKHLEDMRANVLVLLREGASVESGRFDAKLVTRIGRPVPWKQLFVEKVGQAAADFLKRTFKTTVYFDVEVVEHATRPLWLNNGDTADASN